MAPTSGMLILQPEVFAILENVLSPRANGKALAGRHCTLPSGRAVRSEVKDGSLVNAGWKGLRIWV